MLNYEIEKKYKAEGYSVICGVDEAGRGPLSGCVYAAACILPIDEDIPGLNDSKKLTPKKREALFEIICEKAIAYAIAYATPEEIDEINILNASMLAMRRAVEKLSPAPEFLLEDGNIVRGFTQDAVAVLKGDAKSPSIAAASIIAKVLRDRECLEMDRLYPEYGFAAHKGYPTKAHCEAIVKHGVLPIHRKSFLKKRGLV
jgi:ribonuclease HII